MIPAVVTNTKAIWETRSLTFRSLWKWDGGCGKLACLLRAEHADRSREDPAACVQEDGQVGRKWTQRCAGNHQDPWVLSLSVANCGLTLGTRYCPSSFLILVIYTCYIIYNCIYYITWHIITHDMHIFIITYINYIYNCTYTYKVLTILPHCPLWSPPPSATKPLPSNNYPSWLNLFFVPRYIRVFA